MDWYYAREGTRFGPVEQAELARLAAAGELKLADLVWNPTVGQQWVLASTIPNLFAAPSATSAERGSTPNGELTRRARESLTNHWGIAIGCVVLMVVLMFVARAIVELAIKPSVSFALPHVPGRFINHPGAIVVSLILNGPFAVGLAMFFLTLVRGKEPEIGQLFAGFRRFGIALGAYLLMVLFILLWTLLLIIPGIVAALSYAMTFYVVSDNPGIGPLEAITKSKEMMRGYRWKLFCLMLRFVGWALLCLLTCGIGFLWLLPYMNASMAHFYEDVRPRPA